MLVVLVFITQHLLNEIGRRPMSDGNDDGDVWWPKPPRIYEEDAMDMLMMMMMLFGLNDWVGKCALNTFRFH